jgi:hypothetical protein
LPLFLPSIFWQICAFQVLAYILLMRTVELPSESRLWRKYRKVLLLCGWTRGAIVLLFSCKTVLSTLERLSMVANELWRPCTLLCFPVILCQEALSSYSMLSDRASGFIG